MVLWQYTYKGRVPLRSPAREKRTVAALLREEPREERLQRPVAQSQVGMPETQSEERPSGKKLAAE